MGTALPKHPDHLRPVEAPAGNGHEPGPAAGPDPDAVEQWTDLYFLKTKAVVEKFGDARVVYAGVRRRRVMSPPRRALAPTAGRGTRRRGPQTCATPPRHVPRFVSSAPYP